MARKSIAELAAELRREMEPGARAPYRNPQLDPRDEEDAAYRAAWGKNGRAPFGAGLRAAFYAHLPPAPRHTRPDLDGCEMYVRRITEVLEMGIWSRRDQERLRVLREIWLRRAQGKDARYIQRGNVGGRNNAQDYRERPGSPRETVDGIRKLLAESKAKTRGGRATTKFVSDPKWPLGRFNPDRKV